MISFNNIGYMGRLGNQMFQYAALKGIAIHRGYWYSLPSNSSLFECFNLKTTLPNNNHKSIHCDMFEFDQDFFNTCPDDVDISGYFQSNKYFQHIEDEIRQDFTFKELIVDSCVEYKNKNFSDKQIISLHIRRTDYLTDKNFELLSMQYYKDALKLLPQLPVLIFSDDIKWCKETFVGERFTFSPFTNAFNDLCLMSKCDYHIIANSSFSWWGSWLARSKQTIAPKKWFCGEFSNWNTKDLYLPKWILL